jgi:hypothetical protein
MSPAGATETYPLDHLVVDQVGGVLSDVTRIRGANQQTPDPLVRRITVVRAANPATRRDSMA